MRMSLYDYALEEGRDLMTGEYGKAVKVWDWVRSKMDFVKFRNRALYANQEANKFTEVKVVLMEYESTWRKENQTTYFYIPGTGIKTRCLDSDNKVLDYLHYVISDYNPHVLVYTRRKIVGDTPHEYIRQLVVVFNANKRPVPVPPSPIRVPPIQIPPIPAEVLDFSDDDVPRLTRSTTTMLE
jgi:hypothetical protein